MDMYRYKSLELDAFERREVSCCLVDQSVEKVEKTLVCLRHNPAVIARDLQRICRVLSPDELNAEQPYLHAVNTDQ